MLLIVLNLHHSRTLVLPGMFPVRT